MSIHRHTEPGSLRKPLESLRFGSLPQTRGFRSAVGSTGKTLLAIADTRFARLPQEPEDARMTGVTRSLHRRLLALNVSGSLRSVTMVLETKIA